MGGSGRLQKSPHTCASLLGLLWQKTTDRCFYSRNSLTISDAESIGWVCLKDGYFSGLDEKLFQASCLGLLVARLSCIFTVSIGVHLGPNHSLLEGQKLSRGGALPEGLIFTFFHFFLFLLFSFLPPTFLLKYHIAQADLELGIAKGDLEYLILLPTSPFPGICHHAYMLGYFCKDLKSHSEIIMVKMSAYF